MKCNVERSALPPCKSEMHQHLLRITYIAQMWTHAFRSIPTLISPINYDWQEEGGKYTFKWFDGEQLPGVNDITIDRAEDPSGKRLAKLNITPTDTRDSEGLSRFHPYNWYISFFPAEGNHYYSTSVYPVKCCSKHSVTFQAIEGSKMYTYYYLLYRLQVFTDGNMGNRKYISDVPDDMVWKNFLKQRNITNDKITSKEYFDVWTKLIEDPNSFASQMKHEIHLDYN